MNLTPLDSLPLVRLGAGEILIAQDEPITGLFFLVTGEVEVLKNGVQVAEVYEPGAVFGEMSWLLETQPTATVRTLTPSVSGTLPSRRSF